MFISINRHIYGIFPNLVYVSFFFNEEGIY